MRVRLYEAESIPIIRRVGVSGMVFGALLVVLPVGGRISRSFLAVAFLPPYLCQHFQFLHQSFIALLSLSSLPLFRLPCLQLRCLSRFNPRVPRCFFLGFNPRLFRQGHYDEHITRILLISVHHSLDRWQVHRRE